jgi:hypothetical protein
MNWSVKRECSCNRNCNDDCTGPWSVIDNEAGPEDALVACQFETQEHAEAWVRSQLDDVRLH